MPTKKDIARRWTEVLSAPNEATIAAVAETMAADITAPWAPEGGKDAVVASLLPPVTAFVNGTWDEPTISRGTISATCTFSTDDKRHHAAMQLMVRDGLVSKVEMVMSALPPLLTTVFRRVWDERRPDGLQDLLSDTLGVHITGLSRLDWGVHRAHTADGDDLVVRVFPRDRTRASVEGDAAVLRFLESQNFPAERLAGPITAIDGMQVLTTRFVPGRQPDWNLPALSAMGDVLGRLHGFDHLPKAVQRPGGALHLYSFDGGIRAELDQAHECLASIEYRAAGTPHEKSFRIVLDQLGRADDFADLPTALLHTDVVRKNVILSGGDYTLIDWAQTGVGPRITSFAVLLYYGALTGKSFAPERVDTIVHAYREHIRLTGEELDRLADALGHRLLIQECYWGLAGTIPFKRKPRREGEWLKTASLRAKIADRARKAFDSKGSPLAVARPVPRTRRSPAAKPRAKRVESKSRMSRGYAEVEALYAALDTERGQRGLSWAALTREVNALFESSHVRHPIATSTITGMRGVFSLNMNAILSMMVWLDRSPESFTPGRNGRSRANEKLPFVGPSRILRMDAAALHRALEEERAKRGITWAQVASEIEGAAASGLSNLRKGGLVGFPLVMRITEWLGRPVVDFTYAAEG